MGGKWAEKKGMKEKLKDKLTSRHRYTPVHPNLHTHTHSNKRRSRLIDTPNFLPGEPQMSALLAAA